MKIRLRPHQALRFRTVQATEDPLVTTLPLSGFRQSRAYNCGFATALMVLHYFGAQVPAVELFRRLGTGRDGTRQNAILRELRAAGLRANLRYDVDFARICQEIDHNKLIVGYLHDLEHWMVIYGYGRRPDRVFVADPRPQEGCVQPWQGYQARLGGFGIICSQPGDSTAIRQQMLGLDDASASSVAMEGPPPLPAIQLRCEVHDAGPIAQPEPTQLLLPF